LVGWAAALGGKGKVVVTITQADPVSRLHLTVAAAGLPEQQVEVTGPSHAASVLPKPVGAWINPLFPAA
jgi:hypothetical protein